jgi:hypothetical protein
MADVLPGVQRFVAAVRRAGVPVAPDRVQALLGALDALGVTGLYWAGRLTLCSSQDDIRRYDAAWHLHGPAGDRRAQPRVPARRRTVVAPFGTAGAAPERDGGDAELAVAARASASEVLRHRDLAALTGEERAEVRRLLALLSPAVPLRATRRHRGAPAGRVDARRTIRAMLRGLGEPARLARHRPGVRPRRLVLLLDVSGSMAPYADALLRFAHAAVRVRPASGGGGGWARGTEAFTIGTRLTRVTAPLRLRDPDAAVREAGRLVPDWRGGTRLGGALTGYLRAFGHRGMARGAVVVICSDGWECGDVAELRSAMAWLSRLAHRVVWVTPHAGRDGFAPTTGGLVAALPSVDRLVAGHSLAALAELADVLRRT